MISCDICKTDVTPKDNLIVETHKHMLKINGEQLCFCSDCWMNISDWIISDECKKYCKKKMEENLKLAVENTNTDEDLFVDMDK